MKIFKIIYRNNSIELVNGYPSEYYDVNGKICFKVKVFEIEYEQNLKAWSEKAIHNFFDNEKFSELVSIIYVEDFANIFNKLVPDDRVIFEGYPVEVNKKFLHYSFLLKKVH